MFDSIVMNYLLALSVSLPLIGMGCGIHDLVHLYIDSHKN